MDTPAKTNAWLMPASIVLAGIFIGGAIIWNNQHPAASGTGTPGQPPAPAVNIKDVQTLGEPFFGNANAPVTIAFWSDFQCPFCKEFELSTLPEIVQKYVDTGKVKIVFKDFEFLGPDSLTGGEWARAVWQLYPDQYFAWRTAIFNNQPQENSLSAAAYLAWIKKTTAAVSGIDESKIAAEVTSNQSAYDVAIAADKTEGGKFGVNATPSFVIGTQLIAGAEPLAAFTAVIDPLVK